MIELDIKIKHLSESTINKIAAGEVIERPASVIKELIENSIDAKATKIDILLEYSGKNLILITDNGIGMSKEELEVAIQRHTTSKLDEDDFLNINSFGFRGEALPSIGSISKMSIVSKQIGNNIAYKIEVIGGIVKEIVPDIHNVGTKIEIRDLFFATPARLKFLKTDRTELNACLDIIKKIALAHPHISFSLVHEGKNLLDLKKIEDSFDVALAERINKIIGKDFIDNAAFINMVNNGLTIRGYVGIPTFNRASSEDQFLFVNKRPIKDKLLSVALRVAYQDYLAPQRFPVAIIFLDVNPQDVDVNAHPSKSEVRFQNPNFIKDSLISAIKNSLSEHSNKVSTTISQTALGYFNIRKNNADNKNFFLNQNNKLDTQNVFEDKKSNYITEEVVDTINNNNKIQNKSLSSNIENELIQSSPFAKTQSDEAERINCDIQNEFILGAAKAQLHGTYIISQTKDSIIIVDQHAAHERLVYEKIKQNLVKNEIIKQRLLIPEIVELPDENRALLLYKQQSALSNFGLTIEKFGSNSIIVSEIPSLLGDINIQNLIQDLADHLLDLGENIAITELIEHVTETYACHNSIRAGRQLNIEEMNELLRQMEQTPFSAQCNHGRPTYIELKINDIEKLFGRK